MCEQIRYVAEADRVAHRDGGANVGDRPVLSLAAEDVRCAGCVRSGRARGGSVRRLRFCDLAHRVVLVNLGGTKSVPSGQTLSRLVANSAALAVVEKMRGQSARIRPTRLRGCLRSLRDET